MNRWGSLERWLGTDPAGARSAEPFELLDRYVERQLDHVDAAFRYTGIGANLSNCNPCVQNFDGLLASVGGPAGSVTHETQDDRR
jgi:hypothetical protein